MQLDPNNLLTTLQMALKMDFYIHALGDLVHVNRHARARAHTHTHIYIYEYILLLAEMPVCERFW